MQGRTVLVILAIATSTAFAADAACVDITNPPEVIDSSVGFDPTIVVKNNGSESLPDVPCSFNVVRASVPTDTFYYGTANSGYIGVGQSIAVTFTGANVLLASGNYTMTGITELPGDADPHNDTCVKPLFVRYYDVAVEIVSPTESEEPEPVPVQVKLTNLGNVPATVPRLDIEITGGYYPDYGENIAIPVGANQVVTWNPWVYSGGTETCTAWITDPEDMNHHNDTDVVIVNAAGISGREEMKPNTGMSFALSPSPLTGNVLHIEYSLNQAGPANVTLFDISGRPVAKRGFVATRTGEVPMDLRLLRAGIYLVRLEDGRESVVQKLVVQR